MAIRNPTAPAAAHTEVPAVIAGNVPLVRLSEALARAGLTARHDADRGMLVIEPAQSQPASAQPRPLVPADAELGIAWWNRIGAMERARWLAVVGSAVPADAWAAFQSGATLPD